MWRVINAYIHKSCCNINTIQTASSRSESSITRWIPQMKYSLAPAGTHTTISHLVLIHTYACKCAHPHTHSLKYYNYFVYIKKLAQSFNPELHLHCGPARYDRNGISVAHIILTALKNTTLFGKLKDTLRQQKNSGLLQTHKWESNGIMFLRMSLRHSFIKWSANFILLPYQVFFLSGKLQRIAWERKRLVNNLSYNEIWLALFYVMPTTHQFTKTGTHTKCNWASKCCSVSDHD